MYVDKDTLIRAIADLKGSANHMIKIWFVLKAMGLKKGHSVDVDTKNSKPSLDLLYRSGDPQGTYFVPFDASPRWATMKSDAARSVIQTNIQKWMNHKIVGCDPLGYIDISKVGVKYRVSTGANYPEGLGVGKNGFANADGESVAIPMAQFAVWVLARHEIPDTTADIAAYLKEQLIQVLHISKSEVGKVFSDMPFEISVQENPLTDGELWSTCSAGHVQTDRGHTPLQLITYGAPGTGKSHRVDALTNETNSIRVTFHPDTDYSMFVGSYKPTMAAQERYALDATGKTHKIDAKEKAISYSFVPQAFLKAYVEAWRRWCDAALPDEEKRCYLVIEEINRGNCAQIFGDMFQLLDRCESGWSCYAVAPDDDIQRFIGEDAKYGLGGLAWTDNVVNDEGKTIATAEQIKTGARMVLPPNLCILATMNTSDQSLFPIDSAFKRRWDWEYVPITEGRDKNGEPLGWKIRPVEKTEDIAEGTPEYDWWDFVRGVNARISAATRSEDKKIGYFFVKPEAADGKKVVTAKKILSKVIFYLWNDVFKDLGFAKTFSRNGKGVEFNEFYGEDGKMNVDLVREFVEAMVGKTDAAPAQQG